MALFFHEIICSDGGITGEAEILADIKRLKPWFVGISVLAPTYAPALRIASEAKNMVHIPRLEMIRLLNSLIRYCSIEKMLILY